MDPSKKESIFTLYHITNKDGVIFFNNELDINHLLLKKKNEPKFLLAFRQKAYKAWKKMNSPNWAYLDIPEIDYESIQYYSIPKTKKKLGSLEDADLPLGFGRKIVREVEHG